MDWEPFGMLMLAIIVNGIRMLPHVYMDACLFQIIESNIWIMSLVCDLDGRILRDRKNTEEKESSFHWRYEAKKTAHQKQNRQQLKENIIGFGHGNKEMYVFIFGMAKMKEPTTQNKSCECSSHEKTVNAKEKQTNKVFHRQKREKESEK